MIKLLVMDVDGTLTDGKIYMGNGGEIFKSFDIKDGYAIANILPEYHIKTAIITGRKSEIVDRRAAELNIDYVLQGCSNKLVELNLLIEKLGIVSDDVAYIGDDLPDIDCMKVCGYTACPSDATVEVKGQANYVCSTRGGDGAVREFVEYILTEQIDERKLFDATVQTNGKF